MQNSIFRENLVNLILPELKLIPSVLAVWEGGSAANNSLDEYSDLDLCILSSEGGYFIFTSIEKALQSLFIEHSWKITESKFLELTKKFIFLRIHQSIFFRCFNIS